MNTNFLLFGLVVCIVFLCAALAFVVFNLFSTPPVGSVVAESDLVELENALEIEKESKAYCEAQLMEERGSLRDYQEAVRKCYWASSFQYDNEGSVEHFGADYTDYYVVACEEIVLNEWEKFIGTG